MSPNSSPPPGSIARSWESNFLLNEQKMAASVYYAIGSGSFLPRVRVVIVIPKPWSPWDTADAIKAFLPTNCSKNLGRLGAKWFRYFRCQGGQRDLFSTVVTTTCRHLGCWQEIMLEWNRSNYLFSLSYMLVNKLSCLITDIDCRHRTLKVGVWEDDAKWGLA